MTYSTTITSKGQITLPAALRGQLKLVPGRKVTVRREGKHLIIDAPTDITEVRRYNQRIMQAAGIKRVTDADIDGAVVKGATERYRRGLK